MFGTFLLYFFIAQTSHATTTTDSCPYGYTFSLELDDCLDINECEFTELNKCGDEKCFNTVGTYFCGERAVDLLWLVDGTGSYKSFIPEASANFKSQRDFLITQISRGFSYRMGLSFFADKVYTLTNMDQEYVMAIPFINVQELTNDMIDVAFLKVYGMYGGGDLAEDVLLAIVFGMTDPDLFWKQDSIKQVQVFTDNPFHYLAEGRKGTNTPPLRRFSTQPAGLYKDYDKHLVSLMTLGYNYGTSDTTKCISRNEDELMLHQIYFNVVNCNLACMNLYSSTFNVIPDDLNEWVPADIACERTPFTLPYKPSRTLISSASISESFEKIKDKLVEQIEETIKEVEAKDLTERPVIKTTCKSNGIEVIILDKFYTDFELTITNTMVSKSGEHCIQAKMSDHRIYSIPLSAECGTRIIHNDTHVTYENEIIATMGKKEGGINRLQTVVVDFSCSFESRIDLSIGGIQPLLRYEKVRMAEKKIDFNLSMGLYSNESYDTLLMGEVYIAVPELLYSKIALTGAPDAFVVSTEKCWASPSDQVNDTMQYVFIDEFCAVDADVTQVYKNTVDQEMIFSLQSFAFSSDEEAEIYLHCRIMLCDRSYQKCNQSCPTTSEGHHVRRRRSDTIPSFQFTQMKIGPIKIKNFA